MHRHARLGPRGLLAAAALAAGPVAAGADATPAAGADENDVITVTASRVERRAREVPAAISAIDAKRIEQTQMLNVKDAITGTPGVLIDSKNGGYDVRLIIRGAGQKANYGVREIMVLRDGVPMTDPDSFSRFDFIDTQDIERIEITRGPGSLYAGGAAGGTVHIISRSVFDATNRVRLGLGTHGARTAHARYGWMAGESDALALSVSRRVLGNAWRHWNKFDTTQIGLKHGRLLDDGGTWETELSYSEADLQLPGSLDQTLFEEYRRTGTVEATQDPWKHKGRYSRIWFLTSRLEWSQGRLTFKPRVYANRWEHFHPVTGTINVNPGTTVLGTDLELAWEHRAAGAPAQLVGGVTVRLDDTDASRKYKYADVATGFGGRITATLSDRTGDLMSTQRARILLWGLYLQETLRPAPRWLVDLGVRVDRARFDIRTDQTWRYDYAKGTYVLDPDVILVDRAFWLASPRLGVSHRLNGAFNLYLSLAQASQVPSENELRKNAALDPATVRNAEIGLKGRAPGWRLDLALYRMRATDEIVAVLDAGGDTTFQNAGETRKLGLELSGRLRLARRWWLGLDYAWSDYTFERFTEVLSGVAFDRSGNRIPYVPRHQWSVSMEYEHPSGFHARIQSDSWGRYYIDNANSETYEGYRWVTRLALGYRRGPHRLLLTVDNLFDDRYAVEVKKSTYRAGGTWREKHYYYPAAPRAVMLTYRYELGETRR